MEENKNKLDEYNYNLKKVSTKFRKNRKTISNFWKIIFHIIRFLIPLLLSPFILITILIIIFFGGLYMMITSPWQNMDVKKIPSIILSKDKIELLWLEVYEDWEYKGKIKWCENLMLPKNIYTSFIYGYAENAYNSEARMYDNYCLYHMLYIKTIKREFEFEKEHEILNKIDEKINSINDLTNEQIKVLNDEKNKLNIKINLTRETLKILWLQNVWEWNFKNYKNDEYWFLNYLYYPTSYFEEHKKDFLDMLYYNHIGWEYWEPQPDWITLWWWLFDSLDNKIYYNLLNELWIEYNKNNIATDFLNWNFWIPNFIDDINTWWYYYNFNCPPCIGEECNCTWNPEIDYNKNFFNDNLWLTYFRWYINFIKDLESKKVIYISENVKSPFRNYIQWWKECSVNVYLTQRDWPSNLAFWFFRWYPLVDWVKTHAWLDFASTDNCNKKNVPVYSVTDWIVLFKSYSSSSWWNSIIIKTEINDKTYFVRYSHLLELPKLIVWETVSSDTLIWFQWKTWPNTGEHLDLTIYDWELNYENYLHDTLNWWWLFNFSFLDMMQNWFSDYSIWDLNIEYCYNCK